MDSNQYYQENRTPDVVVRNVRKLDNTVNNFHALIHQLTGIKHNEYKSFFLPNQSNSFYTVFIKCREHQAHQYLAKILNGKQFQNDRVIATINSDTEREIATNITGQRTTVTTTSTTVVTTTSDEPTSTTVVTTTTNEPTATINNTRANIWPAHLERNRTTYLSTTPTTTITTTQVINQAVEAQQQSQASALIESTSPSTSTAMVISKSTTGSQTNEQEAADYKFVTENETLAEEVSIIQSLNINDCSGNLCPICNHSCSNQWGREQQTMAIEHLNSCRDQKLAQIEQQFFVKCTRCKQWHRAIETTQHNTTCFISVSDRIGRAECPVCRFTYKEIHHDNIIMLKPCLHILCSNCAQTILETAIRATCPICRIRFNGDDIKQLLI